MNKKEINFIIEKGFDYSENILLQTAIASVPGIGTYIDKLFSSTANKIQMSRIMAFLDFLKTEMEKVSEDKVDKEYLESEDFFDLLYKSFDEVRKTRIKEKQRLFAKILSQSTLNIENTENIEIYLRLLTELSETDLLILKYLYENRKKINSTDQKEYSPVWDEIENSLNIDSKQVQFSKYKLFSLGLLSERYGALLNYGGGAYMTTILLENFIEFISK